MTISREWSTPLTIGSFALMAVTGILMFFHWDTGLNKTAHEWLGWVMVIGVGLHAAANWWGFKRYFLGGTKGRIVLVVSAVVIAASFFSPLGSGGEGGNLPPPIMALKVLTKAPLAQLAPLAGKSVEQLQADLAVAGMHIDSNTNLDAALAGNRDQVSKALKVIFSSAH
jgi:hypothetical protein